MRSILTSAGSRARARARAARATRIVPLAYTVLVASCAPTAPNALAPNRVGGAAIVAAAEEPTVVPPVVGSAAHPYGVARWFGARGHRGEDWNQEGAADLDLGAPVSSIADGTVVFAGNGDRDGFSMWGNVVIVRHRLKRGLPLPDEEIESLYGHLEEIRVRADQIVRVGQVIGTIGTGGGRYAPHLHFEIRTRAGMGIQAGYGDLDGWTRPSEWLEAHGATAF